MRSRRYMFVVPALVVVALLVPLDVSVYAAAQWRTIHNQTFEDTFPTGAWITYDASYTSGQGIWSKGQTGFNSTYAAHNRGGVTPYNYNTNTWMRYGPFSLAGATNARMIFKYWMNTESGYDFFSWEYSCNGVEEWTGRSVSGNGPGPVSAWASVTFSLKPCIGKTQVYVQFRFFSDQSVNYEGVWVDNVKIQKYSTTASG